jgi:hypothetical protein
LSFQFAKVPIDPYVAYNARKDVVQAVERLVVIHLLGMAVKSTVVAEARGQCCVFLAISFYGVGFLVVFFDLRDDALVVNAVF